MTKKKTRPLPAIQKNSEGFLQTWFLRELSADKIGSYRKRIAKTSPESRYLDKFTDGDVKTILEGWDALVPYIEEQQLEEQLAHAEAFAEAYMEKMWPDDVGWRIEWRGFVMAKALDIYDNRSKKTTFEHWFGMTNVSWSNFIAALLMYKALDAARGGGSIRPSSSKYPKYMEKNYKRVRALVEAAAKATRAAWGAKQQS